MIKIRANGLSHIENINNAMYLFTVLQTIYNPSWDMMDLSMLYLPELIILEISSGNPFPKSLTSTVTSSSNFSIIISIFLVSACLTALLMRLSRT